MSRVFVGIGSNEGDRLENLSRAIQALGSTPGICVTQMATIYDTEPLGPPQPEYLNTVVELDTALSPQQLLETLKLLERQLGRVPSTQRWSPRVIDLDILLYDDRILSEPALIIPHPRMRERRFVLEPLAQLAPTLVHPILHKTVAELLGSLPVERSTGSGSCRCATPPSSPRRSLRASSASGGGGPGSASPAALQ